MIKLEDLAAADTLARQRRELIRFTDTLARPEKQPEGSKRDQRQPDQLFIRKGSGDIEIHPEMRFTLTESIMVRIIDEMNRAARRVLDAEVKKMGDRLTDMGVKL